MTDPSIYFGIYCHHFTVERAPSEEIGTAAHEGRGRRAPSLVLLRSWGRYALNDCTVRCQSSSAKVVPQHVCHCTFTV